MGNHTMAKGQQLGQGRGARRDAGRLARRTPSGDARAKCESHHEHTKAGRPGGVQEPDTGIQKYIAEPGPCDRGANRPRTARRSATPHRRASGPRVDAKRQEPLPEKRRVGTASSVQQYPPRG